MSTSEPPPPLYSYQQGEVAHLSATRKHRLLFWEMGTGKTPVVARLGQAREGRKLYLGPASIKQQVARELDRFGGPGTRVQILEGRRAQLDHDAEWVVVNFDLLLSKTVFAQLIEQLWVLLAIDESHLLRNLSAKRTRLVFGHPCLADRAEQVVLMSGTPIIRSPDDLFPAINRLLPRAIAIPDGTGKLRRMQHSEFLARYCIFKTVHLPGGRTLQEPCGAQNVEELRARLRPHMTRLRRRDVLDLPDLRLNEFALTVASTADLVATLKGLPKALLSQLESATGEALLVLLRQHAPQLATLRRLIGLTKAAAAAEHIVERLAGGEDRAIGFFHHHEVANAMSATLRQADVSAGIIRGDTPGVMRQQLIDNLNNGTLQVLLLQSQSGSLGLNLQACRYAAIVEPDWTDAVTQQAIARVYRSGQVRDVTVDFLLLPNSIDERVVGVARRKAQIAADLIETRLPEEQTA